jgi:pimeloyl-ACP methyl ester carboxylesterase
MTFIHGYCFMPDSTYLFRPEHLGIIYKEFQVTTVDSAKINVWFLPSQNHMYLCNSLNMESPIYLPYYSEKEKKPTIIICNADGSSMAYLLWHAKIFFTKDYNVVLFDWRGFAGSQKWNFGTDIACFDFMKDFDAVFENVKNTQEVDASKIGLLSFSTGAYISFLQFANKPEIKSLVVSGMFTSYNAVLKNLIKIKPHEKLTYPTQFDDPENIALDIAHKIDRPVFFIVGEHDNRTPPAMAIELMNKTNSKYRKLWIVENAEHGSSDGPVFKNFIKYSQNVLNFFDETLK